MKLTRHPLTPKQWGITALVVLGIVLTLLPLSADLGSQSIDDALRRALIAYALARGLNGVISVAQGTEVAVQPAGVGVNFTPGQILDPVNDLVERFSWIMMLASSSLGIQKVLLSMSAWHGLLVAIVLLGVLLLASVFVTRLLPFKRLLQRVFLFVLLLRFMMPVIAVANDWVFDTFLQSDYIEASESLTTARQTIGAINDEVLDKPVVSDDDNLIDKARNAYRHAIASVDIDARLLEYRAAAEVISENTLRLIVVFLMQTLVFPLIFLMIIMGLLKRITRT